MRNTAKTVTERDPATRDFYDRIDPLDATAAERRKAAESLKDLTAEERTALAVKDNFYRFSFSNRGGLVMPVILKMDFADGSSETARIPAEIWRTNAKAVTWQFVSAKTLVKAEVDPMWETADADRSNNVYAGLIEPVTLGIDKPEDAKNRMKDSDMKVLPGGLRTYDAPSDR